MPRAQRDWAAMEAAIYRRLGEAKGNSHWDQLLILDLWNEKKDYREMQLQEQHEGFSKSTHYANLAINQDHYSIPPEAGRVSQVVRVYPDDNREEPLTRHEQYTEARPRPGGGVMVGPDPMTYRLIGNFIKLSPPPDQAVVNGLKIEMEYATDLFSGSPTEKLPVDWPMFTENLLILDTVLAALEIEDDQGAPQDGVVRGMVRSHATYEGEWLQYCATRSRGIVYATRFQQGA